MRLAKLVGGKVLGGPKKTLLGVRDDEVEPKEVKCTRNARL